MTWTPASSLKSGDSISTINNRKLTVKGIVHKKEAATVYNFEVESFHSYYVGHCSAWVHNTSSLPDSHSLPAPGTRNQWDWDDMRSIHHEILDNAETGNTWDRWRNIAWAEQAGLQTPLTEFQSKLMKTLERNRAEYSVRMRVEMKGDFASLNSEDLRNLTAHTGLEHGVVIDKDGRLFITRGYDYNPGEISGDTVIIHSHPRPTPPSQGDTVNHPNAGTDFAVIGPKGLISDYDFHGANPDSKWSFVGPNGEINGKLFNQTGEMRSYLASGDAQNTQKMAGYSNPSHNVKTNPYPMKGKLPGHSRMDMRRKQAIGLLPKEGVYKLDNGTVTIQSGKISSNPLLKLVTASKTTIQKYAFGVVGKFATKLDQAFEKGQRNALEFLNRFRTRARLPEGFVGSPELKADFKRAMDRANDTRGFRSFVEEVMSEMKHHALSSTNAEVLRHAEAGFIHPDIARSTLQNFAQRDGWGKIIDLPESVDTEAGFYQFLHQEQSLFWDLTFTNTTHGADSHVWQLMYMFRGASDKQAIISTLGEGGSKGWGRDFFFHILDDVNRTSSDSLRGVRFTNVEDVSGVVAQYPFTYPTARISPEMYAPRGISNKLSPIGEELLLINQLLKQRSN